MSKESAQKNNASAPPSYGLSTAKQGKPFDLFLGGANLRPTNEGRKDKK